MENLRQKIIFISWKTGIPRSAGLSDALGATPYYIEYLPNAPKALLPLRYLLQAGKTISIIMGQRPDIIFAMNPPIILPLVAYLVSVFTGAKLVIDSHTGAFIGKWAAFLPLHRFLSRRSLMTVVTNDHLKQIVDGWGANGIIMEDRLPELGWEKPPVITRRPSVCVINSFSKDEPLGEILSAARNLPACDFYITGRLPARTTPLFEKKTQNVIFTDYIPDAEYVRLIRSVDVIMVLVNTDHTMLCGAYEAVAVEKPLITSDWPVLREYFSKGTLYVDNRPVQIERAIGQALKRKHKLSAEMKDLKALIRSRWEARFAALTSALGQPSGRRSATPATSTGPASRRLFPS